MFRKAGVIGLIVVVLSLTLVAAAIAAPPKGGRPASPGKVYVESTGLVFDTFGAAEPLPNVGPFQQLYPTGGPGGIASTAVGPGEEGFYGGRWWVDVNGDNIRNEGDRFFLCPLLGPGYSPAP
jgi:hypothetical protein